MHMSAAAIAPRSPAIYECDRNHPLFPLYERRLRSDRLNLIQSPSFDDFVYQTERDRRHEAEASHPQYPAFMAWMRDHKGGARHCPAGVFPENFIFWREGGRW